MLAADAELCCGDLSEEERSWGCRVPGGSGEQEGKVRTSQVLRVAQPQLGCHRGLQEELIPSYNRRETRGPWDVTEAPNNVVVAFLKYMGGS